MDYKEKIKLNKELLELRFLYSPIIVNRVKTLSGRKWHPAGKFWTCPPSFDNKELKK